MYKWSKIQQRTRYLVALNTEQLQKLQQTATTQVKTQKLHGKMARRFNSIALGAIIILCILLIYVTNKISSPDPTVDEFLQHPIKSYRTNRLYNNNNHQTSNDIKGFDNSRHMAKYSHYMHNGVEQRTHFSHRKFGGAGFSNSEAATAETTNFVNTSVRIADVIEAQRMRIASKMKDFEYTEQMIGLSALTPETNGQPMQSGELHNHSIFYMHM